MIDSALNARWIRGRLSRAEWPWWIALFVSVTLIWCMAYNRWTRDAWRTPVAYSGDTLGGMAAAKAMATGDILPILPKYPASLGAPFVANWNDYPITDEGVFAWYALFVRLFGVFAGSNLALLSAHLLAAGSFYFVCRRLRYEKAISFAAAILFSMSSFAFARSIWHLSLTFYWHVPLGLLVMYWCTSTQVYRDRQKWIASVVISVLFGIQYVYYTGIFLQFLVLAALVCFIRRKGRAQVLFPLFLAGVVMATFALMNVDTFYHRFANGPNPSALVRIYSGIELYALRPVELFLPLFHRLEPLQAWTNRAYYSQSMFRGGESNSPYLGIVGIAALAFLVWTSVRAIARGTLAGLPAHACGVAWILIYSVVGGINGLIGTFGLVLFRGTNRYSIVILALVLLFLVREITRVSRGWRFPFVCACSGLILLLGLWDQLPRPPGAADIEQVHNSILSDRNIISALQAKLPPRAMIFELPVAEYPEVPPIVAMPDYDHFRPYLQSRSLRFSYGSHKGRTRERWQSELMQFGASDGVALLEKYGFAAVLINRKGYPDRAAGLVAELQSAGRSEILCESSDLIGIALHPAEHPLLPPEFDQNWDGSEGTLADHWRWSRGDASLILQNDEPAPMVVHLSFGLDTVQPRMVEVYLRGEKIYEASLDPKQRSPHADLTVSLQPGKNEFRFRSDRPAELPGNGDIRKVAFRIRNFNFSQ